MSVNATARERAGQAEGAPDPQDVELAWDVVRVRRDGAGPPLLWLHGSHLADLWLPFHRRLAGSLDVIAPTHPGFREGRPPAWLGGFDDLALFYRGLLDALGLDRVHVGGHALGGWLAAELAVLAPDRVASLSLVAPMGLRVPGGPSPTSSPPRPTASRSSCSPSWPATRRTCSATRPTPTTSRGSTASTA
jgi:pimeloyl-ACP methyl ester carboxylesterase